MTHSFKTVGLIGRYRESGPGVVNTLQTLEHYLEQNGYSIILDNDAASELGNTKHRSVATYDLAKHCDLIIVVGGDGSLLNAARCATPYDVPVLGINRGRLGFLTDIHPEEVEQRVAEVLAGKYVEESRFLLQTHLLNDNRHQELDRSLNDVVLMPGDTPHMIEFEIFINKQLVCGQRADGLIVSTPTGSTAYSLSGGGPILHPKLDAIALVPMFPHTLSSRPIVVDANSEIEIYITETNECSPRISCDGHERINILPGSRVVVTKYAKQLRLIHPTDYNYYETLRTKLGWEMHV